MKKDGIGDRFSKLVRKRLAGVESVYAEETTDRDGDPIIRVAIVFEKNVQLTNESRAALFNDLRNDLVSRDVAAFPILSFMSRADGVKFKREFA